MNYRWEKREFDPEHCPVSSVMGSALEGPGGCTLSKQDSTQKVSKHLGDPVFIEGPLADNNYIWKYVKGEVRINVYIREDSKVKGFQILKKSET